MDVLGLVPRSKSNHYQSQCFNHEAVELGCTYQSLRRHRKFVEPIPINTASIELKGAYPDARELR